jgi:hypothetical protein
MNNKDKFPSGFYSWKGINYYLFGGKIILSAFMVQNNSLGVINIDISNKEVKVGENFSNISDDELIDKKIPLTQLVFKDRDSIDIMIEQLTFIRNKLNKTAEKI